jgi:hypothetical protein
MTDEELNKIRLQALMGDPLKDVCHVESSCAELAEMVVELRQEAKAGFKIDWREVAAVRTALDILKAMHPAPQDRGMAPAANQAYRAQVSVADFHRAIRELELLTARVPQ